MSREILFRGKVTRVPKYMQDKNRMSVGDWVYGSYVDYPVAQIFDREDEYIVDPATVGQFTGLCDKNGVKIFEGDILRDGLGDDGVVTYFESIASFKYRVGNEVWNLNEGDPNRSTQLQYTEIIGNVHDNPELMEVSE